jgi:hypothetical protein
VGCAGYHPHTVVTMGNHLKRVLLAVAGTVLLGAGAALLLVLAGLILLSAVFPRLERHLEPVRRRAVRASEESVASPLRIAGSLLVAAALIGAGVVWTLNRWLPLGGWPTGSGLIASGLVLCALLAYSHRQVRRRRTAGRP